MKVSEGVNCKKLSFFFFFFYLFMSFVYFLFFFFFFFVTLENLLFAYKQCCTRNIDSLPLADRTASMKLICLAEGRNFFFKKNTNTHLERRGNRKHMCTPLPNITRIEVSDEKRASNKTIPKKKVSKN